MQLVKQNSSREHDFDLRKIFEGIHREESCKNTGLRKSGRLVSCYLNLFCLKYDLLLSLVFQYLLSVDSTNIRIERANVGVANVQNEGKRSKKAIIIACVQRKE